MALKSLEIVNEMLDGECDFVYNYERNFYVSEKMLETIQLSLEVLEIIKNKKVDIAWFKECFEVVTLKIYSIEEALEKYNDYKEQLTLEEATKLYQWLEENE